MPRIKIGLTGNIASGKGEAAGILSSLGCRIIDADAEAHQLYRARPDLVRSIAANFGPEVLNSDGSLNRKALGALVFADPAALNRLNDLVRPPLQLQCRDRLREVLAEGADAALDAALIIEWGWEKDFDSLWLVTCPEAERIRRLMVNRGLSEAEARARVGSQMPEEKKIPFADYVLPNEKNLEDLAERVRKGWDALTSR